MNRKIVSAGSLYKSTYAEVMRQCKPWAAKNGVDQKILEAYVKGLCFANTFKAILGEAISTDQLVEHVKSKILTHQSDTESE